MMANIRDPTGDIGKGSWEMVLKNRRDRTMGTAWDLVAGKVVTLVGEMEIPAKAKVSEEGMVTTPTPPPPRRAENAGRRSELSGRR